MADFSLTWTPGVDADSQYVRYREKGDTDWIDSINIDAPNPQTGVETTADILGLDDNAVYQFQIQTVETGKVAALSDIKEKVNYDCPGDTKTVVGSSINIALASSYPSIDTIYFRLHIAATEEVIATESCSGVAASVTFNSVATGTYFITFYMEALVDGVNYTSIDQLGDYCSTTNVVVS